MRSTRPAEAVAELGSLAVITRMEHVLNKVVNEAGRLLRVDETRFAGRDGFLTRVALTFERLTAHISAAADDDTVVVSLDPPPNDADCVTAEAAQQSPLGRVYGFTCQWAWLLTNQQGYADGVRFEFCADAQRRVVEMIVAASQIHYYEFTHDG
ncbi:MAG: DUF6334 family protein [Verrucomicrobiaceae bacterium]